MIKYVLVFCGAMVMNFTSVAQKPSIDSSLYYDDLFTELDVFLDSLTQPRTMFLANVELGNNFLNYKTTGTSTLQSEKKFTISPSIGYFHKSGFGFSGAAAIITEDGTFNPYQFQLTGSYDYLSNFTWGSGISLTHYFTKDSLSFYTTPLQNEAVMYVTYKGGWLKPVLGATYGWGSKTNVAERQDYIKKLRLRPGTTSSVVTTEESISDFSLSASVKHDFYWLETLGAKSALRFSPQLAFTSGTQKFGFNQTTNSFLLRNNKATAQYNSENIQLDDKLSFQPLSLSAYLKGELTYHRFFIQPQFIADYYFPADANNISTAFRLSIGVSL